MQQTKTDIDRKLAIYYHPLFQQIITLITNLFSKDKQQHIEQKVTQIDQAEQLDRKTEAERQSGLNFGFMEFIEFNLKLQKCLLPTFEPQNAIISGLNDWVKEVAECLNFDGMVITTQCQQINESNFQSLLRAQIVASKIQLFQSTQKYMRTLSRLKNHDAFKLLGVKINKQVFSKFMFDLCSTWCQFLDIQMFVYFLLAIYLQISEGQTFKQAKYKSTHLVQPIDLEFMEQFQQIKQKYAKNKKKQLRYYRAWCEWNYLRVGQVGQGLILCLDNIFQDNRVLQIALVFQKAINVINEQITSQSQFQSPQNTVALKNKQDRQKGFLIMKKINKNQNQTSAQAPGFNVKPKQMYTINDQRSLQNSNQFRENMNSIAFQGRKSGQKEGGIRIHSRNQRISQDQFQAKRGEQNLTQSQQQGLEQGCSFQHHDFQIQIDQQGDMYLKRIIKLPILGSKIQTFQFDQKKQIKLQWIERKRLQCRKVSNLYRRLQSMKVRLQHNVQNDHYFYKKNPKLAERDRFYQASQNNGPDSTLIQRSGGRTRQQPMFQKSIHQKPKPDQQQTAQNQNSETAKAYMKPKSYFPTSRQKDLIRRNADYIHKVIAPSFLTDHKNNLCYSQKQGSIYGVGAQDQRRDIKLNLPKIKFLKDYKVLDQKSYHIIGKLTKSRQVINQRVKSISMNQNLQRKVIPPLGIQTQEERIHKLKGQYHHVWAKYINQEQILELTNFTDFYRQLQKYKQDFGHEHQSSYRLNLKPIILYQNKRCQMGGVITKQQQVRFFSKMKKLINRDQKRKKRKQKKQKFRQYKKTFKSKNQRSFYEQVFINYHKKQITEMKKQRSRIKSQIVQFSSTAH